MNDRTCKDCQTIFPATTDHFYLRRDKRVSKTYLSSRCKKCHVAFCKRNRPIRTKRAWPSVVVQREERLERRRDRRKQQALARGASGVRVCTKCSVEKPIHDFEPNRNCDMGYGYRCLDCRNAFELKKVYDQRVTRWTEVLLNSAKVGSRYREQEMTITEQDIKDLYVKQKGRCYWYNVPIAMTNDRRHPLKPSLDRLDAEKGYTVENVVLTCMAANFGRGTATFEVFQDFVKVLRRELPLGHDSV